MSFGGRERSKPIHKLSSWSLLAFALTSVTGCGPAGPPTPLLSRQSSWSSLEDGSRLAIVGGEVAGQRTAMRCWARSERQDCLILFAARIFNIVATRRIFDKLPAQAPHPVDGYRCGFGRSIWRQYIYADGKITERRENLRFHANPWSRSSVERSLRGAPNDASIYLNCGLVAELHQEQHLDAISDPSLRYDDVMN